MNTVNGNISHLLNEKRGIKVKYKDDSTIGKVGIPVCKAVLNMNQDGVEKEKYHIKFRSLLPVVRKSAPV